MNCPVEIGTVLWVARTRPEPVDVTCPVCSGALFFVATLGDGERVAVECSACQCGYEQPSGTIREYVHEPFAARFTVAAVVRFSTWNDKSEWTLRSEEGSEIDLKYLHATEEEALSESRKSIAAQQDEQMGKRKRLRSPKGEVLSRAGYQIRYCREQIKDAQRRIDWNLARVKTLQEKEVR